MTFISTKLNLNDGTTTTGYYLDEQGTKELLTVSSNIRAFSYRVESLEKRIALLFDATFETVVQYRIKQIMEIMPTHKSVRQWDITKNFSPDFGAGFEAWKRLEAKGFIESRGSGWYRKKSVEDEKVVDTHCPQCGMPQS